MKKKVFIGGSRRVGRLNSDVRRRLDRVISRQLYVLIGDANGADKAVQAYLKERAYPHVVIFCTAGECRNNLGGWRVQSVAAPSRVRDFQFFTAKDAAMAREADAGFMIWDGKSLGTMVNAGRLIAGGKPVVIYVTSAKTFWTVRSLSQLEELLHGCSLEVRHRIDQYMSEHARESTQSVLL